MRLGICFSLFLSLAISVGATSVQWVQGVIVLRDESVKSGEISHDTGEIVLFRSLSGHVFVYPAHQVASFRYHDAKENINRVFVSRIDSSGPFKSFQFYESVVMGWINVFRKAAYGSTPASEHHADQFNYYVEWNDTWITLTRFRQIVYPLIRKAGKTSQHLLSELNGLNPNRKDHALRMIILYNQSYPGTSMAGI